jgi:L-amino acid N-acyltransferase YncA
MKITLRKVGISDAQRIMEIYNYYIANTVHTFETEMLTEEQVKKRIQKYAGSHSWYVAESDSKVIGYAYTSEFVERSAYKYTSEVTIFIDKEYTRGGCGKALLGQLIEDMKASGFAALISIIAVPNTASVKLHKFFGFENVGCLKKVGYKLGKWINVEYWELVLRE